VVVALAGKEVSSAEVSSRMGGLRPGQKIGIVYLRDGNKISKETTLVNREEFLARRVAPKPPPPPEKKPVVLGIHIEERDAGIFVTETEAGFTGSVAGIETGDKLLEINGKQLKVLEDVVAELKKVKAGDELTIKYARGEKTVTAKVVGAHGNKGAKLISKEVKAPVERAPKPKPKPQPPPKVAAEKRGFLGIAVVPASEGVLVEAVVPDSAAAAAGIQKGDVVKELEGQAIKSVDQLKEVLSKKSAGDKIRLVLVRDGETVKKGNVTLGAPGEKVPAPPAPPKPSKEKPKPDKPPPKPAKKEPGKLGILASQPGDNLVRVKKVFVGGPAEKAGLKPGDVIVKANGKDIRTLDDLGAVLQGLFAGDELSLLVKRGEQQTELKVKLGKPGEEGKETP
jgi:S1-C subfamily serine protease